MSLLQLRGEGQHINVCKETTEYVVMATGTERFKSGLHRFMEDKVY